MTPSLTSGGLDTSRWYALTLSRTLAIIFPLLALLLLIKPQNDPDLWWHIRSGQIMLAERDVIRGDLFSYTLPGVFRTHHEWLSEPVMAWLYDSFGHAGNLIWVMLYVPFTVWLAYQLGRGNIIVRALILIAGCAAASIAWTARTHLVLSLLGLCVYGITVRWRSRFWLLPLIACAWVNLHGSWITAYLIAGAAGVGELFSLWRKAGGDWVYVRRLAFWTIISIPCLLLNPYGFDQLYAIIDTAKMAALPYIQDWIPPTLDNPQYIPFAIMLLINGATLVVAHRHISPAQLLIMLGFTVWALQTGRVVALHGLVTAVICGEALGMWAERRSLIHPWQDHTTRRQSTFRWLVIVILAFTVIARFIQQTQPAMIGATLRETMPVDAVTHLNTYRLPAPIFNEYDWGGYLILYAPDYPVFMDGRADLYDDFFSVYLEVVSVKPTWSSILDQWDVQTILVYTDGSLAQTLQTDPAWRLEYQDDLASLFVRHIPLE